GPAVVTRIDLAPDQPPGVDSLSRAYWVLHHFGLNPMFDEAASILFEQVGNVPSNASAQQYQLYARAPRAEGDTWQLQDAGDELLSGPDGGVLFNTGNGVVAPAQFVLTRPLISPTSEAAQPTPVVRVWPNPVSGNGALNIQTNLSGKSTFRLYDAKGRAIRLAVFERDLALPLKALPEGVYFYSIENETVIKTGKLRVK
ncbi:MAG: T9SS type A sorting domain-containing protein, partial [Saprospiraceae bacterium]